MRLHPAILLVSMVGFCPQQAPDAAAAIIEKLRNQLGLSTEQFTSLKEVLDEDHEYRKKLDDARTSKIKAILSDDQKKAFSELPDPFGNEGPRGDFAFFGPGRPGRGGEPPTLRGSESSALEVTRKLLDSRNEEWKVIKPKLAKIVALRQSIAEDLDEQRGMPFGRGPGGAPGSSAATSSPLGSARANLKAALVDSAPPDDLAGKVAALRKALGDAREELRSHQRDLALLLTAEQATAIAGLGYLD
jgi:hypothetical protein